MTYIYASVFIGVVVEEVSLKPFLVRDLSGSRYALFGLYNVNEASLSSFSAFKHAYFDVLKYGDMADQCFVCLFLRLVRNCKGIIEID